MVSFKKRNDIPSLVKCVKKLKVESSKDLLKMHNLSEFIFEEWLKLKSKRRKTPMRSSEVYAQRAAEEELVVGLLSLLNEKIINFIVNSKIFRETKK